MFVTPLTRRLTEAALVLSDVPLRRSCGGYHCLGTAIQGRHWRQARSHRTHVANVGSKQRELYLCGIVLASCRCLQPVFAVSGTDWACLVYCNRAATEFCCCRLKRTAYVSCTHCLYVKDGRDICR